MSQRLGGLVAIVTETRAGIGRATALRFADEGASVVCLDADGAEAEEAARQVAEAGGAATASRAVVANAADAATAVDLTVERYGRLDVLCNNTSMLVQGTVEETDEARWNEIFAVNVKSVFQMTRSALPALRRSGGGAVVSLAWSLALIGFPGLAAYSATKGAVRMLTKCLAIDHAADAVRVNCICHGGIDDPLLRSLFDSTPDPDGALAAFLERVPTGRIASVEDMANAALYLASPESAGTTGSELVVDGGQTAW
jgi:NAD(P)-dependent dehydrogenase (short-subunit alcohol dehydrogenase family)